MPLLQSMNSQLINQVAALAKNPSQSERLIAALKREIGKFGRSPEGALQLNNVALSLKKLGRFNEATDYFLAAARLNTGSSELIDELIAAAFVTGRISEVSMAIESYKKECPRANPLTDELGAFDELRRGLNRVGVAEATFRVFSEHLENVIIESNVKLFASSSEVLNFAGGEYLLVEFETKLEGPKAALLNDQLRDSILADDRLEDCWDKVIYNFSSSLKTGDSSTAG